MVGVAVHDRLAQGGQGVVHGDVDELTGASHPGMEDGGGDPESGHRGRIQIANAGPDPERLAVGHGLHAFIAHLAAIERRGEVRLDLGIGRGAHDRLHGLAVDRRLGPAHPARIRAVVVADHAFGVDVGDHRRHGLVEEVHVAPLAREALLGVGAHPVLRGELLAHRVELLRAARDHPAQVGAAAHQREDAHGENAAQEHRRVAVEPAERQRRHQHGGEDRGGHRGGVGTEGADESHASTMPAPPRARDRALP